MVFDPKTEIDFPLFQGDVLNGYFGSPDDPSFEKDYMRICDLTELSEYFAHVRDWEGSPWSCRIYCNWVMIDPLTRAFGLLTERGLAGELRTFDGCYNNRPSSSGTFKSMHAWGLAIDINAGTNGRGREPTLSDEFVLCFAQSGFEWGGLWVPLSSRDGMHFQLPWIRERSGPLAPIPWRGNST